MAQYQDHMLILKSRPYREADLLLTLFGIKSGKIGAVAKGARRPKSRLAGIYPLSYAVCQIYHGRSNLDTLTAVDLVDGFPSLQKDLDKLSWAMFLADFVDEMFQERDANPAVVPWLIAAWERLSVAPGSLSIALTASWHLLKLAGYTPKWDACEICHKPPVPPTVVVDWENDVLYCHEHSPASHRENNHYGHFGMEISFGTLRTWQQWMTLDVSKIGNYDAKGLIAEQLFALFGRYVESHIGRMPRSLQFVREVENMVAKERNKPL